MNENIMFIENTNSQAPTARTARVSAVRLDSYDPSLVNLAVERLLSPLGGIGAFIRPGSSVVLKPNFLVPRRAERAVCTHPEIIRATAALAKEAGAGMVAITDSPAVGSATRVARRLGLRSNDTVKVVDSVDGVAVASPRSAGFHHLTLSRRVAEAEVLINIAKAKTHGKTVITGAVKNSFGAIIGMEKAQWHLRIGPELLPFAELLVHVHSLVAPRLNILDAVIAMEGNGPGSGDPRPLGLLLASENAHAVDAVFSRIIGLGPREVPTLAVAQDAGLLGPIDQIEIVGDDISDIRPDPPWRMARMTTADRVLSSGPLYRIFDRFLSLKPAVDQSKCSGCGQCAEICAAQAITVDAKAKAPTPRIVIDDKRCISCFCCQEICPEGAIRVRSGLAARLLGVGTR